jgi:hypothetical protein
MTQPLGKLVLREDPDDFADPVYATEKLRRRMKVHDERSAEVARRLSYRWQKRAVNGIDFQRFDRSFSLPNLWGNHG